MLLGKREQTIFLLFLSNFLIELSVVFRSPILIDGADTIVYYLSAKNGLEYMIKSHIFVPIGFPLIIRFFLFFHPSEIILYFINPLISSFCVVVSYFFVSELFDRKVGLVSALLLMVWLLDENAGSGLMSDVSALFFLITALYACFLYTKNKRPVHAYAFFILSGLGFLVRYTNAVGLIVGGLWCFYKCRTDLLRKKEVWLGVLFFLLTIMPQLIINHMTFGSPLPTVYLSSIQEMGVEGFSFKYIFAAGGFERSVPNLFFYIVAIFSPPWAIPFYVIASLSLFKNFQNNFDKLIFLFLWFSPFFAFNLFYFWQATRFLLPINLLLLMLIAYGMVEASRVVNEKTVILKSKSINYRKVALFLLFITIYLPQAVNQYDWVCGRKTLMDARTQVYVWLKENTEENSVVLHALASVPINYYSNRTAYDVKNVGGNSEHFERTRQIIKNNENVYLIDEMAMQSMDIYGEIRTNFNLTLIQELKYRYRAVFRREYTFKIYKIS